MQIPQQRTVTALERTEQNDLRPGEIRYGWCPLRDINLTNNGTIDYYVQPPESPYHRTLFRNELIPFVTFVVESRRASSEPARNGVLPPTVADYRQKTALEAIEEIAYQYERLGFTVLTSLQGLEQSDAHRIFRVVVPFAYKLAELETALGDADKRIESFTDLVYKISDEDGEADYKIEALRDETEREIARRLLQEVRLGAQTAVAFARTTLNETIQSMTAAHSGGKGKAGADALDIFLSGELDEPLPKLIGKSDGMDDIKGALNYLANREKTREEKEAIQAMEAENAELKRQLEELKTAQSAAKIVVGDTVKVGARIGTVTKKVIDNLTVRFEDSDKEETFKAKTVEKL